MSTAIQIDAKEAIDRLDPAKWASTTAFEPPGSPPTPGSIEMTGVDPGL